MIRKFRKRPVEIEAVEFNGSGDSYMEILDWTRHSRTPAYMSGSVLRIRTLEGDHDVTPGDFVIKGVADEFYPCKPEIFGASYDEVLP